MTTNFGFDPVAVRQGRQRQRELRETHSTMGTENGADVPNGMSPLDKDVQPTRMAGVNGNFAMKMMHDPEAIESAKKWMSEFGMSNQGVEWNMGIMPPPGPSDGDSSSPSSTETGDY